MEEGGVELKKRGRRRKLRLNVEGCSTPNQQQSTAAAGGAKRRRKPANNSGETLIRSPAGIGSWGGLRRVFAHPSTSTQLENNPPPAHSSNFYVSTPLRSKFHTRVFSPSQFLTPERSLLQGVEDSGVCTMLQTPQGSAYGRSTAGFGEFSGMFVVSDEFSRTPSLFCAFAGPSTSSQFPTTSITPPNAPSFNNGSRTPTPLKKAFAEIQQSFLSPVKMEDLESILQQQNYSPFTPETPSKSISTSIYSPLFTDVLLREAEREDREQNSPTVQQKKRSAAKKINFSPQK